MDTKKIILALAIALVLNLFVNYGISVFYKAPQYNDFCTDQYRYGPYPAKISPELYYLQQNCTQVTVSEDLQKSCAEQKGYISYKYNSTGCPTESYCETCGARFDDVNQQRNSNVFVILVVFGVAAIIAGLLIKAEAVANGFLVGGILSLLIAAIRNWGQLQDVLKFAILGIVLALLIWIGYKKSGLIEKKLNSQQQKPETKIGARRKTRK